MNQITDPWLVILDDEEMLYSCAISTAYVILALQ